MALNVLLDTFHEYVTSKEYMICLFMDLSRAFDTISHDILLNKLYKYGIKGLSYDWIKSYYRIGNNMLITRTVLQIH